MSLDRILPISISLADPPIGLLDFGTPLIAATLTGPQVTAFGGDLTRVLTPANWQAQMTAVGVTSSEDSYRAVQAMFSQRPVKPSQVVWGRRATAVAQVSTVTIPASPAAVDYVITINGVAHTVAGSGLTQEQLRDALIAAINGGSQMSIVDAAIGTSSTLTVTALEAGVGFSLSTSPVLMTAATTTPGVGLVEDIAAMRAETAFYLVTETSRSIEALYQLAIAIETYSGEGGAPPLFLLGQTLDPLAQSTDALTDLMSRLSALNLLRTAMVWNDDSDEFVDTALVGKVLPTKPGSNTWANQPLSGVSGLVPTSDTRLAAKRYTWLESYVAAGFSMSQGARTASGHPIDLVIGRDWLRNRIQIALARLLRDNPKIPYTDSGAGACADTLRAELVIASNEPYNLLDESSIEIEVPLAASQDSVDRGNRLFRGITWQATGQGAIEGMPVDGTISQ